MGIDSGATLRNTAGTGCPSPTSRSIRSSSSNPSTTRRPTRLSSAELELAHRLVVAVNHQPLSGHPGLQGNERLALRSDVDPHPLLVDEARHCQAQEGLGGVDSPVAKSSDGLPAAFSQMVLVVHEKGRSELRRQVDGVASRDREVPVLIDFGVVGEQVPREHGHRRRWYRQGAPGRTPRSESTRP